VFLITKDLLCALLVDGVVQCCAAAHGDLVSKISCQLTHTIKLFVW
jgi:hypothetical protein